MATFITSQAVGQTINVYIETSTGYWKYNHDGADSSAFNQNNGNQEDGSQSIMVTNANGEFTIISCDIDGIPSGNITLLNLSNTFLTSFDGTGLSSLYELNLNSNQLTSFNGTGLSSLTILSLNGNQLTSLDVSNMDNLTTLYLHSNKEGGNPLTPSANDQILSQLVQNGLSFGQFRTVNGRTSASNADYTSLVNSDWTLFGLDLIPPTFITSKQVGTQIINAHVETSTGFWKYNHDGVDSSAFPNGWQNLPITNANGEFTIISCDVDGLLSGDITLLELNNNQLTSFDGTGLSSLTSLNLSSSQLASFDGTDLSSLTTLNLNANNHLTSFDGTGLSSLVNLSLSNSCNIASFDGTDLSSLTDLSLAGNQLTSLDGYIFPSSLTTLSLNNNNLASFDGTGLSNLVYLSLGNNQLTSFDGTGLSSLTDLQLNDNQLTSFDGTGLSSLTDLRLYNNNLASFDGTDLSSLVTLTLNDNQLTSFNGTGLSSLTSLNLGTNQLTSVDVTGLSSLTNFSLNDNLLTPLANNQVLHQLSQNGVMAFGGKGDPIGWFSSNNGRTAASNADYDNLFNNLGWRFQGLDLVSGPVVGNGKLRVKGVTTGI